MQDIPPLMIIKSKELLLTIIRLPKEFEDFEIAFISDINLKNTNDLDRLDNNYFNIK